MSWRLVVASLLLAVASVQCLYEYQLDKGKDLFAGYGVAFKYPSDLMLMSRKLINKKGLMTTIYPLIAKKEWDTVVDVDFQKSFFKGQEDGMLINFSPRDVNSLVTRYDTTNITDFGFIEKVSGLVVVLRLSSQEAKSKDKIRINVYAKYFPKATKFKPGQQSASYVMTDKTSAKDIEIDKGLGQLTLYVRYEAGELSVLTRSGLGQTPQLVYTVKNATDLARHYLSFSAASGQNYVSITVPRIFYKTDTANTDVVYFEEHEFQERQEIFNYIHYMHDIVQSDTSSPDEMTDVNKIDDAAIIEKMIGYQQETLDYLRPTLKILGVAEQEVSSIFRYIENYKGISKKHFVRVVAQVDKMLKESGKQLTFMSKDVDKLTKKFLKGNFLKMAESAHTQMQATTEKLKGIGARVRSASEKVTDLKSTLNEGHAFLDNFQKMLTSLPETLRRDLESTTQRKSSLFSTLLKFFTWALIPQLNFDPLTKCLITVDSKNYNQNLYTTGMSSVEVKLSWHLIK